jgi:flagellar L-ring protein FlgH
MGKKMIERLKTTVFLIMVFLIFINVGCVIAPQKTRLKEEANVPQTTGEEQKRNNGSLWQDGGQLSSLFVTYKARKLGDIVTINIVESSTASNEATTTTGRKSSIAGQLSNLFGLEKHYPVSKVFNPFSSVASNLDSEFAGNGTTERSGKVSAYITARVSEVLANGDFKIIGCRDVKINHETQNITISGIIRPKDLSADNVILSTYIADAQIAYNGKGVVDDRQHPGWMGRILDRVWPF